MSSTADTLDLFFFFFNDTAPPEIYPLSLHDALPISRGGVLAWLVGPGRLSAQRVVAGEPAVIDRALGTWMQEEELLQVKRRYADHTTWEPKVGAFASIQRALGAGGRRFAPAAGAETACPVA